MADTSQIVVGHFEASGSIIYLPLGFKPDYWEMCDYHTNTNIIFYKWWGRMEDDQASGKQEGISIAEGVTANLADDGGFAAYGSEQSGPTITRWSAGLTVVAKTATTHGTYIKPSTSSGMDKEAVFEVLENTTTGATEPTWPAAIGEQVKDNHGSPVLYERVNTPVSRIGYDGIRIAGALMTDGQEVYYLAVQADNVIDHGDVASWTGGIQGM